MPRTVPSLVLQNPGSTVASSLWNSGPKAMGDFYTAPPMFRGLQSSPAALGSATWYPMGLQSTTVDTDGGHSNVTNNTRYTCQVAGWYWVHGFSAWANVGSQADLFTAIAVNGTIVLGTGQALQKPGTDLGAASASGLVQLQVNDYVETWGRQDTGSVVNTWVGPDLCSCMGLVWVHG